MVFFDELVGARVVTERKLPTRAVVQEEWLEDEDDDLLEIRAANGPSCPSFPLEPPPLPGEATVTDLQDLQPATAPQQLPATEADAQRNTAVDKGIEMSANPPQQPQTSGKDARGEAAVDKGSKMTEQEVQVKRRVRFIDEAAGLPFHRSSRRVPTQYPLKDPQFYTPGEGDAYFAEDATAFVTLTIPEPKTVKEAMFSKEREGWIASMGRELQSLLKNHVYDLVEPLEGCHLMGNKWVFCEKTFTDGTLDKLKSRLVALGYTIR